jgi:hypothetical protein
VKEHFRSRSWHCRHGLSFGIEGKMVEGGGKGVTGASRKVGDVDLLACEEDDDVVRLEKEKGDVYGIVMVNFGLVLGVVYAIILTG